LLKVTSIVSLKISLERDAFCNLTQTVITLTIRESFSGKVTIRESSFRETSFQENNHPGKLLSGKHCKP